MLFNFVPLQNVVATGDGLAMAADIATIVVGVAIVVVAFAGVALARKMNRTLDGVRTAVGQNLGPVSERARVISDNVEFISQALRTDVERLNASVRALSDRLHQASDHMEERIEDFNALMEVVQEEAEGMFIDTAATVRGVREGAAAITRSVPAMAGEGDTGESTSPEGDRAGSTLPGAGHSDSGSNEPHAADNSSPETDDPGAVLDEANEAPHDDGLEAVPTREG
jgi:methyl-accepting chemotaxis protein